MKQPVSFAQCLQEALSDGGISASEAARLVGFRSRNSIFRILSGETSAAVEQRFLVSLREAVGESWPKERWQALEDALSVKCVGLEQFRSNQAFMQALQEKQENVQYTVETNWKAPEVGVIPLKLLLDDLVRESEVEVIVCGHCDRTLTTLLLETLRKAGDEGRAVIRHYIDIREEAAVQNILGILPLLTKVWYNARLVEEGACSDEMAALYRINVISIRQTQANGQRFWHQLLRCDASSFAHTYASGEGSPLADILDRCRFQLELLKPIGTTGDGAQAFVEYTAQYEQLERDGMILSIKPDIHFNCVPTELLYQSIMEGFAQTGLAEGPGLLELLQQLQQIHDERYRSIYSKHRPTHLVYSIPAMERFMQTGVQSDHFFVQRAYTMDERKEILRRMYQAMQENPYFNMHFLRRDMPEFVNEMTYYENKGVLLLDAYTGYDLHDDHSEALITLPVFQHSFCRFFMDTLLPRFVLSRAECCEEIERLLGMAEKM